MSNRLYAARAWPTHGHGQRMAHTCSVGVLCKAYARHVHSSPSLPPTCPGPPSLFLFRLTLRHPGGRKTMSRACRRHYVSEMVPRDWLTLSGSLQECNGRAFKGLDAFSFLPSFSILPSVLASLLSDKGILSIPFRPSPLPRHPCCRLVLSLSSCYRLLSPQLSQLVLNLTIILLCS